MALLTVKGTSLEPAAGNKGQRAVETPSGMLNCIGLENPGSEYFLKHTLPELKKYNVPVIVNIYGHTPEEYGAVAKKLDVDGVDAVEINISCPNVKEGGIVFGTVPEAAAEVVRAVKANTGKMVIAKLSPNVTDIVVMAKAVEAAGADAISMINTLLGTKIDIERQRPVLRQCNRRSQRSCCTSGSSAPGLPGGAGCAYPHHWHGRHHVCRGCN